MPAAEPWFSFSRPHLEWLNWQPGLDVPRYVAGLVDRARRMGSDALAFPCESGGELLYPGTLAPRDPHIGGADLVGELARQAHGSGLKFLVCFLGLVANAHASREHPEWVVRDARGEPAPQWPGCKFRPMCPNSAYPEHAVAILSDAMRRYPVDGLYVEGVGATGCFCPNCRQAFRDRFGRDLEGAAARRDRDFIAFLQGGVTRVYTLIRAAIDRESPGTVFLGCAPRGANIAAIAPLVDAVTMECQWGYGALLASQNWMFRETGLVMKMLRAQSRRPVVGTTWVAKNVDYDYAPRSAVHVSLCFDEILFNGGTPQVHIQNAFEVDGSLVPCLADLYAGVEALRPYLLDAEPVRYAGLADWMDPGSYLNNYFEPAYDALRGWYKALSESSTPVSIVPFADLNAGGFEDLRVLVLPDAPGLDPRAAAGLERYVRAGGGLVFTHRTGWDDPQVLSRLDRLALIDRSARRTGPDPEAFPPLAYYRVASDEGPWAGLDGRLFSWRGTWVGAELSAGAREVATIHGIDPVRAGSCQILHAGFPGQAEAPLVVTRELDRGRVVYIGGSIDSSLRFFYDPAVADLLVRAVRWAGGGRVPIRTDAPCTVEINAWRGARTAAVLLLNLTTNQLCPDAVIATERPGMLCSEPIHSVIPLRAIEVGIDLGAERPRAVRGMDGRPLAHRFDPPWLSVVIDALDVRGAILIDFDG